MVPKPSKKRTPARKAADPEVLDPETDPSEIDAEVESEAAHVVQSGEIAVGDTHELLPASSAGLPDLDPFKRYMAEVQRYPLLTPEEELKLALELKQSGSLEAAKRLVTANLRLVVKIAYEYRQVYANMLDLIQEGNIGLMKAVSKYDPSKGVRLSYYAAIWVRSYILKYLLDNFRLVKIGTTQAQKKLFYQLMREKERLEAQGLLAGPKLLAEKLDVREKDVQEMQHRLSREGAEVSIDAPVDPSEGRTRYADFIGDDRASPDQTLEENQWLTVLKENLPSFEKKLTEKEKRILHDRILSEEPKTLQEVADLYGLTRERVRQIESKIIDRLRSFLKERTGEDFDS